jgi:hypothetical protein
MNHKPAARNNKSAPGNSTPNEPGPPRRPPQFPLGGLLGLMAVAAVAMAPAYYILRGQQGENSARLVGMLMILAGPLLLVFVVSSLLSILRWWNR